ncbi:ABC transporter permease [Brevibacterium jeotgali]|uniref:Peptide/nickel transport system permease protein n=1 Tax=Brevibacterium jeotgali TaxID=1262550 RepID=A0A2H1L6H9_9MICO|nr:ABC transporter permease [Brevibacterium jeotgali]TWB99014.1 peptide/nickel transport system permease protein [Brevibacterium jeotgali]SMY12479.1 peptide/nickel transport system permease protein [Brevibacterium jeotgali]
MTTPAPPDSTASTGAPAADVPRTRSGRATELTFVVGLVLVGIVVVLALVSFVWTPHPPTQPDAAGRLEGMSAAHPFGTDRYGRDTLTWIMLGARVTLLVGIVAVGIAMLIGVPLGVLAGMTRARWLSGLIMRGNDLLLAFPALLLAIVFSAVFGPGTGPAMAALGIAAIPAFARVARSGTLQIMGREYIAAARTANRTPLQIAIQHVVPNIAGLIIVQASVTFALSVLAEAGLSFLGLGTQPPTPSWGRMLQESQQFLGSRPELAIWPGLFIAIAVLGFNLLGDGLRDRLDPTLRGRS